MEEGATTQPLDRRERRRQQTREEILTAARELLLEVGPEEITLRQVARRADFSPASLYTYFSSREEMIAELIAGSLQRLASYVRRVPLDLPPDRRVVELGIAYMDFAYENPVDLRCVLSASQGAMPDVGERAPGLEAARLIGQTFREGVEAGVFVANDDLTPAEMAYSVWALVHGIVTLGARDLSPVSEDVSAAPRRVLEAYVARLKVSSKDRRR